jgi:hypothetical protein
LDKVSSTRDQEQFGAWEELVEGAGNAAVQRGIGFAEDYPDRTSELS